MPYIAYLHTGSNEGDRLRNLEVAQSHIERLAGAVVARSPVYETAAWGVEDQPDFLNQALKVATACSPLQLLEVALGIEQQMGRRRIRRWGQRLIDVDLLFYGQIRIHLPRLRLPHPELHRRNFVLLPLRDIAPELLHPELGLTVEALLAQSPDPLPAERYQGEI